MEKSVVYCWLCAQKALETKEVGRKYYLHMNFHSLKGYSKVRRPDRARLHFVKSVDQTSGLTDLLPGDLLAVKGQIEAVVYKENEIDLSSYPLLYWRPLMDNSDPVHLTAEIISKLSPITSQGKVEFVTFSHGGVEHKIVNDGYTREKFIEILKKEGDVWMIPDHISGVVGENVLFATETEEDD